jgi:hypothetical protein
MVPRRSYLLQAHSNGTWGAVSILIPGQTIYGVAEEFARLLALVYGRTLFLSGLFHTDPHFCPSTNLRR